MPNANLPNPAGSSGYEELAAITSDPGMRRLAWWLGGDLADNLLRETWYAVARAAAGSPSRTCALLLANQVNIYRYTRRDLTRLGSLADDPVRSGPGSTTSHQSDRCGDRSCVSPPTACAVTSRQRPYPPTRPSLGPGRSRSLAGWPTRPAATRGTTTPAPA